MANLSREDVLKLARLARLHLSEDEVAKFTEEIGTILGYVEQLQNVDVGKLEPTAQVTGLVNVTRPDEEKDYGTTPEDLLKNAPELYEGYIKVKRMLT